MSGNRILRYDTSTSVYMVFQRNVIKLFTSFKNLELYLSVSLINIPKLIRLTCQQDGCSHKLVIVYLHRLLNDP